MKHTVKVKDKKQYEVVIQLMISAGISFSKYHHGDKTAVEFSYQNYDNFEYPIIGDTCINATRMGDSFPMLEWPKDAEKIIDILFEEKYEMPVGDYTAKVTSKGIEVGCQNISFETLNKLVNLVDKFKKANA